MKVVYNLYLEFHVEYLIMDRSLTKLIRDVYVCKFKQVGSNEEKWLIRVKFYNGAESDVYIKGEQSSFDTLIDACHFVCAKMKIGHVSLCGNSINRIEGHEPLHEDSGEKEYIDKSDYVYGTGYVPTSVLLARQIIEAKKEHPYIDKEIYFYHLGTYIGWDTLKLLNSRPLKLVSLYREGDSEWGESPLKLACHFKGGRMMKVWDENENQMEWEGHEEAIDFVLNNLSYEKFVMQIP
ncbi:MAG: hypothetical protein COA74_11055 [Gammaproteobacteria bacterium]|nr:MAG: hypothetical protein COA74_11055 [Gammaproteobacteria bacterium]